MADWCSGECMDAGPRGPLFEPEPGRPGCGFEQVTIPHILRIVSGNGSVSIKVKITIKYTHT